MTDAPAPLCVDDALAIVQRALVDLHAYMAKPPAEVDPQVCMSYLNKCAVWVGRLPPLSQATAGAGLAEAPRGNAH